jgi:hypothetical protein
MRPMCTWGENPAGSDAEPAPPTAHGSLSLSR